MFGGVYHINDYVLNDEHPAVRLLQNQLMFRFKPKYESDIEPSTIITYEAPFDHEGDGVPKWVQTHHEMYTNWNVSWVAPVLHARTLRGPCKYVGYEQLEVPNEPEHAYYMSFTDRMKHLLIWLDAVCPVTAASPTHICDISDDGTFLNPFMKCVLLKRDKSVIVLRRFGRNPRIVTGSELLLMAGMQRTHVIDPMSVDNKERNRIAAECTDALAFAAVVLAVYSNTQAS